MRITFLEQFTVTIPLLLAHKPQRSRGKEQNELELLFSFRWKEEENKEHSKKPLLGIHVPSDQVHLFMLPMPNKPISLLNSATTAAAAPLRPPPLVVRDGCLSSTGKGHVRSSMRVLIVKALIRIRASLECQRFQARAAALQSVSLELFLSVLFPLLSFDSTART
ncbi:hypothetical protein OPV22_031074 [Ensete ventricosum]|uniref:Uncharacterized protein n=1 Tax=Ensete ventricosum TaxID=4639 RepID=A0AAV8PUC1_ENSVE|nr:hypothetical protein OPV22_031074 [Ensete ventricosum]